MTDVEIIAIEIEYMKLSSYFNLPVTYDNFRDYLISKGISKQDIEDWDVSWLKCHSPGWTFVSC